MSALVGTHPKFRQSPPIKRSSTSATRAPSAAAPAADTSPAVPAPSTSRLYRSCGMGFTHLGGWVFSTRARLYTSSGATSVCIETILGSASLASANFPLAYFFFEGAPGQFRQEDNKPRRCDQPSPEQ